VTSTRAAWPLLLIALSSSCRCDGGASEEPDDARACASACAALVTAGCERPGLLAGDAARCEQACLQRSRELLPARCQRERRAYLGCVSRASIDCERARSSASVCIEQRQGIEGCAEEHAAFERCIAPCLHPGTAHLSERDGISVEIVRAGCAGCGELERGAPTGSACQSPKVCAQICCACPDGRAQMRARVCAGGACAGDDACALARKVGPDPCH
jgi:hypothetical protein